ncbi:MAG: phosphopentomutase [Clostridiales bacterium]|nr:phosphopentomutase [Clostridiales bacterium]
MPRIILMIIDSVGIGEMPDAEKFGDLGANTFGNIYKAYPDMKINYLKKLGISKIHGAEYIQYDGNVIGSYGKMMETSNGKDTTTGHWEIAGLHLEQSFKTYPNGFPEHIIEEFENRTGRKVLFNKPASGTVILEELGEVHMKTGMPIVYTSADSVFQIAAHEDVIPLDELYSMCQIAREILMGEDQVARIIARPFIGKAGHFERTPNRRDFSISPYERTILDELKDNNYDVIAIGKIVDIYNGQGITEDVHTISNMDGVDQTLTFMKQSNNGLIFTNLVDFDAKYGHRRNVEGYKDAIEDFDARIPELIDAMNSYDILIITADHGNDPTFKGTDHTREMVPLLVYSDQFKQNVDLGTRKTFADIAATIAEYFKVDNPGNGISILNEVMED